MSVVLAWWGVSVVGEQVATRRDSPFSQEAIDVPPATSAPETTVVIEPTVPAQIDPNAAAAITGFLDTAGSTTTEVAPPVTTTATTARPRSTTVPTSPPATEPAPTDDTSTPTTVAPTTSVTTTAPATTTTPPATTTTTVPVDRGVTTTTAPTTSTTNGSSTSTSPFPPGWDDRDGFEPKKDGQSTFTFDCGSITIHWHDYEIVNITGELYEEHRSCERRYGGAELNFRVLETGEIEFVITYPNGKVDRYVMPAPPPH
jgi:hypothetical protein